jgi:hypothetical protein
LGRKLHLRDCNFCGEERGGRRRWDRLARGDSGGVGTRHRHGLDDGDRCGRCRGRYKRICGGGNNVPGGGRERDEGDGLGDVGDDPGVFGHVGGANAGKVRKCGLDYAWVLGPT